MVSDGYPRLLAALASLNQIGATINRSDPARRVDVATTLRLIAESAVKVVPGASAVIYTYDEAGQAFDRAGYPWRRAKSAMRSASAAAPSRGMAL